MDKKTKHRDFPVSVNNRNELVDYDYTDKLDDAAYVWLMRFNAEYVNANFDKDQGTLFNNEQVLESYKANNRRNGDLMLYKRARRLLRSTTKFGKKTHGNGTVATFIDGEHEIDSIAFDEDYMTTFIELKKVLKQVKDIW